MYLIDIYLLINNDILSFTNIKDISQGVVNESKPTYDMMITTP